MVVTSTILGAYVVGSFGLGVGIAAGSGVAMGIGAGLGAAAGAGLGYMAGNVINDVTGLDNLLNPPEMPKAPETPPVIEQGEESVRRRTVTSELDRRQKAYYLTKGQPRDNATLAGYRETLGG